MWCRSRHRFRRIKEAFDHFLDWEIPLPFAALYKVRLYTVEEVTQAHLIPVSYTHLTLPTILRV